MALQVWLPLNGDLKNKGILSIYNLSSKQIDSFINDGATTDSGGKIGSCYSFDGVDDQMYACHDKTIWNDKPISFACWVKCTKTRTGSNTLLDISADLCLTMDYNATNGVRFGFWRAWSNNGTRTGDSGLTTTYYNADTWYHVVYVCEKQFNRIYVNGTLSKEWDSSSKYTSNFKPLLSGYPRITVAKSSGSSYFAGASFNDVRIYDNALSSKEIKEISQGLILHYKLDDDILTGENIMPNNKTMELGSASPSLGRWRLAGTSNMTRSRVEITDSPVGTCYGFQNSGIQTANDGSCYGIDSFPFEPNTIYTIAFYARITNGTEGYAGYNIYSATYENGSHTKVDKNYRVTPLPSDGSWTRCWLTFKTNGTANRNIYIGITTGDTTVTTQICYVCIWKGLPDFSVYDSSGYGHHGTRVTTTDAAIISQEDSRRNSFSTKLNSTLVTHTENGMAYIVGECGLTEPDRLTVAWWMNPLKGYGSSTSLLNGAFSLSNNGMASDYLAAAMNHRDGTIDTNSSDGIHIRPTIAFTLNQWHHYAIVYDGRTATIYKDGEVSSSALFSVTKSLGSFSSVFIGFSRAGGVYRKVNGSYSDFRIYATALSSDDIKELYEVSASIDNFGNVHAYEFVEDGEKVSIEKNGLIKSNNVNSEPIVCLPLNGSLDNFGSTNATVTVNGTTLYSDSKFGYGLSCNKSSYWIVNLINIGNNASICWWEKSNNEAGMPWVLTSNSSAILNFWEANYHYYLNNGDSYNNPFVNDNNVAIDSITGTLTWHHYSITFNGSECKLYIDGEYKGKAQTYRNPTTTNNTIKIAGGYRDAHSYDWRGTMNDFRVYDRCLTEEEVVRIYTSNGFIELGEETSASIGNQYVISDSFIER